jgi:hypothetical protein
VLVVHPFAYSINMQYSKRRKLFSDPDFLPQFELCVVQAPQTVNDGRGLGSTGFSSWFEALESLKFRVGQADFDVAIVGAGAYGFPLASFVKSLGKVAIHLGGATQLLFGIWGNRWNSDVDMQSLRNRNWVRPSASETPVNSEDIEGAAYW